MHIIQEHEHELVMISYQLTYFQWNIYYKYHSLE